MAEEEQQPEEKQEPAPADQAAAEEASPEETPSAAEEVDAPGPEEVDAPAEPAPADEPAEEAPADEPAEEVPADEPAAAVAEPEADAEPAERLTPKQRRKLERSQSTEPAAPPRDPETRAAERAARRKAAAAARRRYRASQRGKRGEPGQGTPPAERRPGAKKVRQGTVVSNKADKTITVKVEVVRRHRMYEKVLRHSATLHAHDERNEANEGDVVRIVESRPLSRTKRWRLVEVLERAR